MNSKGAALASLGKYEEAAKAYEKANEINSHNPIAWPNKGSNLGLLGKPTGETKATKAFDKATRNNPHNSDLWINKGFTLNNLDKTDEAIKAYEKENGGN